jgi:hypothetical protein
LSQVRHVLEHAARSTLWLFSLQQVGHESGVSRHLSRPP